MMRLTANVLCKKLSGKCGHQFVSRMSTHKVFNQGTPLMNFNLYKSDPVLLSFTDAFADPSGPRVLNDHGLWCGTEESMRTARFVTCSHIYSFFVLTCFAATTEAQRPTNLS